MTTPTNFDRIIPRRGTGCIKWDRFPKLDPFWVADMDFEAPRCVLDAIRSRVDHGVFGYAQPHDGLIDSLLGYLKKRHGLDTDANDIVHLGGLVMALSLVARAVGNPGDVVMTCTPNYPPFIEVHTDAQMDCISVPHIQKNDRWEFDWEAMEAAVTPKTKVFLLSNPQNPLGRVFSRAEVEQLAEFCLRHDMVLVSDEIHCDLVLDESATPHVCGASLPDRFQSHIITLLAPSKTYNIAGLGYAFALIKNDELRQKFNDAKGHTLPEINCLAYYAAEAAYRDGESWRQELLAYLRRNRDTLSEFVKSNLPGCIVPNIEATYLAWIDCRALGHENPAAVFEKEAQLYLSDGNYFGAPGHVRFNYGCPHSRLLEGLDKMAKIIA